MFSVQPSTEEIWFFDTSALVTLAHDSQLFRTALKFFKPRTTVLMKVIVSELQDLAKQTDRDGLAANAALTDLGWLGNAVELPLRCLPEITTIQVLLNNGIQLPRQNKHAGEAHIMVASSRQTTKSCFMLCDDFNARSISLNYGVIPLSVHRFLYELAKLGLLNMTSASGFAKILQDTGRSSFLSPEEFEVGNLGRIGDP